MSDTGYSRPKRFFFDQEGLDLNTPGDRPKRPRRAPEMMNLTYDVDGTLVPRPGTEDIYSGAVIAGQTDCHFVRRISDEISGTWARVIGVNTRLTVETSAATPLRSTPETGFSGNPFTSAVWRPTEANRSYLYLGDSTKIRKVDTAGNIKLIGLAAPKTPPTVELGRPWANAVSDMETAAAWAAAGVAGAVAAVAGGRVNTTLEATSGSIYDSGTTGWACFRPVTLANIGVGSLVTFQNGLDLEAVRVAEVYRAGVATTIQSVIYESGTTGLCVIQPANAVQEFRRNAVVKIVNGGTTEYCRILAVVEGVNGQRAIRLRTTNAFAATHTLTVMQSFRAYTVNNFPSASNVTRAAMQSTSTAAGAMKMTDTVAADLTQIGYFVGASTGTPMSDDDYITVGLRVSDMSKITNIRVMFSLDAGAFASNYYFKTIDQSVLVAAAKNTQTTAEVIRRSNQQRVKQSKRLPILDLRVSRDPGDKMSEGDFSYGQYDLPGQPEPLPVGEPDPVRPATEMATGDNQWFDVTFRRGDCTPVVSEQSKGWKDIDAVRIEATVTAINVVVSFNSLNISGGFGIDSGKLGEPYQYRYRHRDSRTGVVSDYSPECLERVSAYRDQIVLSIPPIAVTDTDIDKYDIERWGGTLPEWLYVGSVASSVATQTFTDQLDDLAIIANGGSSNQRVLQPWVTFDNPASGTADVAGFMVSSNTAISSSTVPGTKIVINGIATTIRQIIGSTATTTKWQIADSIGTATTAAWEIPVPVLAGQPLAAIWRHDGDGYSTMFACNGQYLRWSLGNNPDATTDLNYLELTDANDPLVMGFSHNGRCGVFTSRKLFQITGNPVDGFKAYEVPNGKGLVGRYALAVGDMVSWIAKDGAYQTTGTGPLDIVSLDLGPLFVTEEGGSTASTAVSVSINNVYRPKIDTAEERYLRLDYADDGSLMFFYNAPDGLHSPNPCLRYVPQRQAWLYYEYNCTMRFIYAEEGRGIRSLIGGGQDGKLYRVGGANAPRTDNGTGFIWLVRTFSEDFGDARAIKRFGDVEVDVDANGQTVNIQLGYDDYTTTAALGSVATTGRTKNIYTLGGGDGTLARNIAIKLYGTTAAGNRLRLYSWEPSVEQLPANTNSLATTPQTGGYDGDKYMQGIRIVANTYNQAKVVEIRKDDGTVIDTITVQHNGVRNEVYSFATTSDELRVARLVWLHPTTSVPWNLIAWEWMFNREPAAAKVWEIQYTGIDAQDYFHTFQLQLALASSDTVTLKTYVDGGLIATNTVGSTGSVLSKPAPVVLPARLGKLVKWRLESPTPFRLYQRDCAIWVMPYGGQGYAMLRPFGDVHRDRGAEV